MAQEEEKYYPDPYEDYIPEEELKQK